MSFCEGANMSAYAWLQWVYLSIDLVHSGESRWCKNMAHYQTHSLSLTEMIEMYLFLWFTKWEMTALETAFKFLLQLSCPCFHLSLRSWLICSQLIVLLVSIKEWHESIVPFLGVYKQAHEMCVLFMETLAFLKCLKLGCKGSIHTCDRFQNPSQSILFSVSLACVLSSSRN